MLGSIALQHEPGIFKTACKEILSRQEEIYPAAIPEHKGEILGLHHIKLEKEPPSTRMVPGLRNLLFSDIIPPMTEEETPCYKLAFKSHATLYYVRPAKKL